MGVRRMRSAKPSADSHQRHVATPGQVDAERSLGSLGSRDTALKGVAIGIRWDGPLLGRREEDQELAVRALRAPRSRARRSSGARLSATRSEITCLTTWTARTSGGRSAAAGTRQACVRAARDHELDRGACAPPPARQPNRRGRSPLWRPRDRPELAPAGRLVLADMARPCDGILPSHRWRAAGQSCCQHGQSARASSTTAWSKAGDMLGPAPKPRPHAPRRVDPAPSFF